MPADTLATPDTDEGAISPLAPEVPAPAAREERGRRAGENWFYLSLLVVLGGISAGAYYLGFVSPYRLEDYYWKPLQDLAKINGYTNAAANAWAFTWVVLFACYYLAFRLCPPSVNVSRAFRWIALGIVGGWAAVFCATLVYQYPVGAADLFDQVFRARIMSEYGLNPFTTNPSSIVGDLWLPYVAWPNEGSPYGPAWELAAAGTSLLAGDSLWTNLVLFKLLVVLAYAGSAGLTYATLRAWKPEWALRGTIFFAWNPLVLFEIAGNGHNDAFVVLFILLAVFFVATSRRVAMLPALALGALTKFVPVLLVPAAAAYIWREREPRKPGEERASNRDALRTLAIGAAASVALAVVLYAPFWEGPRSIGALGRQGLFTASIPKVVLDWLHLDLGVDEQSAQNIVRLGALVLVSVAAVAAGAWVLWARDEGRRTKGSSEFRVPSSGGSLPLTQSSHPLRGYPSPQHSTKERTLRAFYDVVFVYLAFCTLWFQPWYLLWLIALTAPLASYTYANRTLLFCIGGVLHYFVWDFLWLWNRSPMRQIQITDVIVVYTLPLFYTAYIVLKGMGVKRRET